MEKNKPKKNTEVKMNNYSKLKKKYIYINGKLRFAINLIMKNKVNRVKF
jgi:hypothetical protein